MNDAPTTVCDVSFVRNMGWPTGRESYGHRVRIVVVGVTPHQGDGNTVTGRSRTGRIHLNIMSEVREMLLQHAQKYLDVVRKRGEKRCSSVRNATT
jgi:hypothetical protein